MKAIHGKLISGLTAEVKTRASLCMGAFAVILTNKQLASLTTLIINKVKSGSSKAERAIQAQCLSLIANTVRSKLAPFVAEIIPVLHTAANALNASQSIDEDNELVEACLTALHAIVFACPTEIKNFAPEIYKTCMNRATYDPSFTYQDVDMIGAEDEEKWDYDDEDGFQEEAEDANAGAVEDSSWKVRRGAIRVMEAIIVTRPEMHLMLIQTYGVDMAERFKERVDIVKTDLLEAFKGLVVLHGTGTEVEQQKRKALLPLSQDIITHIVKQSESKNQKVRSTAINTLAALAGTIEDDMDKHIEIVMPFIEIAAAEEDNFDAFLDALNIMGSLFKSCRHGEGRLFINLTDRLTKVLMAALEHSYPRVVGTGLSTTGIFLCMLHTGYEFQ